MHVPISRAHLGSYAIHARKRLPLEEFLISQADIEIHKAETIVGDLAAMIQLGGKLASGRKDIGSIHLEVARQVKAILREDDGQRQIVEFCPCGHTAWFALTQIIAMGGFRQLLDTYRVSAPTFPTERDHEFVCRECAAELEYQMERLAYMMSL